MKTIATTTSIRIDFVNGGYIEYELPSGEAPDVLRRLAQDIEDARCVLEGAIRIRMALFGGAAMVEYDPRLDVEKWSLIDNRGLFPRTIGSRLSLSEAIHYAASVPNASKLWRVTPS